MRDLGHNTDQLWEKLKSMVFKTIASVVSPIAGLVSANVHQRENIHELFGFDILLDSNLRPWLIEVNVSPRSARLFDFTTVLCE